MARRGLSAAVYAALLSLGVASSKDVAAMLGVDQARVRRALGRLMKDGYVEAVGSGRGRLYYVVRPLDI